MGWVYQHQPSPESLHRCRPPIVEDSWVSNRPDGNEGSIWRCDQCRQLWLIYRPLGESRLRWRRARWIIRLKVRFGEYEKGERWRRRQ